MGQNACEDVADPNRAQVTSRTRGIPNLSLPRRLRAPAQLAIRGAAAKEAAMKRLIKFVLGLTVGATVAVLLTPKSGRELREKLMGGTSGRPLPLAPGSDQ